MTPNKQLPYNPKLRQLARELRKNSTLSEVLLWQKIKGKALGYEFHRQVPIDNYIVDFFCHELMLAIEVDGASHDSKFEYDVTRKRALEKFGISILNINDFDIKRDINNTIRAIEITISDLNKNIPLPPSKGELGGTLVEEPSINYELINN